MKAEVCAELRQSCTNYLGSSLWFCVSAGESGNGFSAAAALANFKVTPRLPTAVSSWCRRGCTSISQLLQCSIALAEYSPSPAILVPRSCVLFDRFAPQGEMMPAFCRSDPVKSVAAGRRYTASTVLCADCHCVCSLRTEHQLLRVRSLWQ